MALPISFVERTSWSSLEVKKARATGTASTLGQGFYKMTTGPIETPGLPPTGEGTEDLSGPAEVTEPTGTNPAWQPVLDALPDDALRNMVMPHLQKWDQGVQERFQQLHQQYEPWKALMSDVDPVYVQQAIGLAQKLEEDPEFVYNKLAEAYGFTQQPTGQQSATTEPEPVSFGDENNLFDPNDPVIQKVTQMEGVLKGLQDFLQSQQQRDEQQAQIEAYNAHMEQLKAKYPGPYDEDVIDAMVAQNVDPETAIQRYQDSVKKAAQAMITPSTQAPPVMSSTTGGSGLPTEKVDPATLSSQDSKKLAEAVIKRMMGQGD